ncbi:hypothetical protein [Moraxella lacunata]
MVATPTLFPTKNATSPITNAGTTACKSHKAIISLNPPYPHAPQASQSRH